MNGLLREAYDRRRGDGVLDRLRGTGRLGDDRQERFNRQVANYEDAIRRGDDVAAAVADQAIDTILNEAREARTQVEASATDPISFDGGVRGHRPIAPAPGFRRAESSRELFRRALRASQAERAERAA